MHTSLSTFHAPAAAAITGEWPDANVGPTLSRLRGLIVPGLNLEIILVVAVLIGLIGN
jgi:hypothetical protein